MYLEGVEDASLGTSFFVDDFELNATTTTATGPTITIEPVTQPSPRAERQLHGGRYGYGAAGLSVAAQWDEHRRRHQRPYDFDRTLADNGAQYQWSSATGRAAPPAPTRP